MTELKPCPFCGDDEELRVCQPPHMRGHWVAHCGACGGEMQAESENGAIAGWNTRHSVTDEGLVERSEIIAAFEKDDEMHRRLFSCTLAQEAETRAAYLEAYADTVSKAMYAGERPSGI
jgi:Lar family restriction alleviation protein